MAEKTHRFGGGWTEQKLTSLGKYLKAYTTIMAKQRFVFAYIDAFAGSGYVSLKDARSPGQLLLPEFSEEESRDFLKGSARIALETSPRFKKYIFIESNAKRAKELEFLREEFPDLAPDVDVVSKDANSYIQELCGKRSWTSRRAVLFLDPYGMQVNWETLRAIAGTHAIDLWLLFPAGIAINRLLRRDAKIDEPEASRLDQIFGASDWREKFYRQSEEKGLFESRRKLEKTADLKAIGIYFLDRLRSEFAGVAANPQVLRNSRNVPLYLLCFAAGNPKGAPTALKIAEHILGEGGGDVALPHRMD